MVEEDIDEMFGEADNNKDGRIDFDGEIKLHIEQDELLHSCGLQCLPSCLLDYQRERKTDWTSRFTDKQF